MPSLLIVSADPGSIERISTMAERCGVRVKSVAEAGTARNWLSMQDFDIVFIDSRYPSGIPVELIQTTWKRNSFAVAALFNFYGAAEDEWTARLLGAHVFLGAQAERGMTQLLQAIPESPLRIADYGLLVVEDLDSPRDIICTYIEALGFTGVDGVSSVREAIDRLRARPNAYFAVVTDLNMPNEGGLDLLNEIRRDEQLSMLPVIVLTAYATGENLMDCIKAGATGFVVKPPQKKTLRMELEKARRLFVNRQPPRLCRPEEAHLLEDALASTQHFGV